MGLAHGGKYAGNRRAMPVCYGTAARPARAAGGGTRCSRPAGMPPLPGGLGYGLCSASQAVSCRIASISTPVVPKLWSTVTQACRARGS